MAYYQFKLTPLDTYFFGGEKHDKDEKARYFVESNCYPQQTALLGFVRYFLLMKNGLLGSAELKEKGTDLIGEKSFEFSNNNQVFGKIKRISALYFLKEKEVFIPAPRDFGYSIGEYYGNMILQKADGKTLTAKDGLHPLQLINVKTKNTLPLIAVNSSDEGVVFSVSQNGNEKLLNSSNSAEREEKFYKQTFMKMNSGWSFGVIAELDVVLKNETIFLPFGGEKSFFKVEIEQVKDWAEVFPKEIKLNKSLPGLYIVSDCFLENVTKIPSTFSIVDAVSFRNMYTTVRTENYSAFGSKSNGLKRSDRYNLLKRGSVFYFSDTADREKMEAILNNPSNTNIGFNYYININ